DVLDDGRAALPRTPGQRQGRVDRVRAPVTGNPHGAGQIVRAHERTQLPGPGRRDHLDVDAEAARHGRAALELDQPLRRTRHADAAAAAEARRLPGLRLQLLVE